LGLLARERTRDPWLRFPTRFPPRHHSSPRGARGRSRPRSRLAIARSPRGATSSRAAAARTARGVMSETGTVEAVAHSGEIMSEDKTENKWVFDCHVDGSACHALEWGWTKLWKDCVKWNDRDTYRCPGQGCTEKLKLVNDSHGAHVRLKRQVEDFGNRWGSEDAAGNNWEHAYVVIPTCSKCNRSYIDLTRECKAVKVADLDEKGGVIYVGSITQGGHTVHLLEEVKFKKLYPKDYRHRRFCQVKISHKETTGGAGGKIDRMACRKRYHRGTAGGV